MSNMYLLLLLTQKLLAFQTAVHRIVIECVNCEISLLKRNVKMNDYSNVGVEVLHHFPSIIIIHVL